MFSCRSSHLNLLPVFACLMVTGATGQQYFLCNYSLQDRMAGIAVQCLAQDARGYFWIGTQDGGLSRLDGKTFVNYSKHDGIGDNSINCLYDDQAGNIWIGTPLSGAYMFYDDAFSNFNNVPSLCNTHISAIGSTEIPYPIAYQLQPQKESALKSDIGVGYTDRPLRMFLVEDNMFNQMAAGDSITDMFPNAELVVAENGQIAVEKVTAEHFDIVLIDAQMPVMDGYTAARTMRTLPSKEKNRTPIIALTAPIIKSEVDKCFESGMNDFIAKPFDIDILQQKIIEHALAELL